jgi:hypothetical protein
MNEGNLHARGHPGIQVVPLAWALADDVVMAAAHDVSRCAPLLQDGAFRAALSPGED